MVLSSQSSTSLTIKSQIPPSSPSSEILSPSPSSPTPYHTLESIAKHKTPASAYTVIHNTIYDLTSYLPDHPGGARILQQVLGKDGSHRFEQYHSGDETVKQILQQLPIIGRIYDESNNTVETVEKSLSSMSLRDISESEVAKHNNKKSCWTIVNDYVYDLTEFAPTHPGGERFILNKMAGKNGTEIFDLMHDDSVRAQKILEGCKIGKLASTTNTAVVPTSSTKSIPYHFIVKSITHLSSTVRIISLSPSGPHMPTLPIGHHILVVVPATSTHPELTRAYTPIDVHSDGSMDLLIKVYPHGKASNYLFSLDVSSPVSCIGPSGEFQFAELTKKYETGTWLLLGGGTGITPMYQILRPLLSKLNGHGQVIVVMASKNVEEILLRPELDALSQLHTNLTVNYLIADSPPAITESQIVGLMSSSILTSLLPSTWNVTNSIGLVCGPEGFVNASISACEMLGLKEGKKEGGEIFTF